jgi:hypothetical protein
VVQRDRAYLNRTKATPGKVIDGVAPLANVFTGDEAQVASSPMCSIIKGANPKGAG